MSTPPLARVDRVFMLTALLAGVFFAACFCLVAASADRLPSWNVTLRELLLALHDSLLLRFFLDLNCSSGEPDPMPDPRISLLIMDDCGVPSSVLSSL